MSDRLVPFERHNVSHQAAAHMRNLILSSRILPGEKIRQDALAEELGISRIPLREALLALEAEGLVILKPGRGAFAATISSADIEDQYEVYAFSHGLAASRAASRAAAVDEDVIARLTILNKVFSEASSREDIRNLDREFHRAINLLGSSGRLRMILLALSRFSRTIPAYYSILDGDYKRAAVVEHRLIIDALAQRNGELAAHACAAHLRREGVAVVEALRELQPSQPPEDLDDGE